MKRSRLAQSLIKALSAYSLCSRHWLNEITLIPSAATNKSSVKLVNFHRSIAVCIPRIRPHTVRAIRQVVIKIRITAGKLRESRIPRFRNVENTYRVPQASLGQCFGTMHATRIRIFVRKRSCHSTDSRKSLVSEALNFRTPVTHSIAGGLPLHYGFKSIRARYTRCNTVTGSPKCGLN